MKTATKKVKINVPINDFNIYRYNFFKVHEFVLQI